MTKEERIIQIKEQIAECDAAISRAIRVKAYNNSGVGVSYQELKALREMKSSLVSELNELNGRSPRRVLNVIPRDN